MKLRAGDWVEVKSKEEILATLDKNGRLEEMPFMPQMFEYCGRKFKIYKRAHKTCDTVYPIRGRRLSSAVHLELRCDGATYGGCQAACLIFWKTAWLKAANADGSNTQSLSQVGPTTGVSSIGTTEVDVIAGTYAEDVGSPDERRYICQATQLPVFTTDLNWWDARQYMEDVTSGNVTISQLLRGLAYASYNKVINAGIGLGCILRWLYDRAQSLWGGIPYPRRSGSIPVDQSTPTCTLNLQPGELVRVKPFHEILTTLNTENKNKGLYFDAEAVPYCGDKYRVRSRLNKFIDEKTGKLITMKNDSILLEGVWCRSRYSACRMFCPRSIYSWWREIWLERLPSDSLETTALLNRKVPVTPKN
ncbi:hypothetical protein [Nitrospira sp. BLG_1]|uniref:hypothetical protein n=1 Tax=Nitrospira sp. BLG_1 TaxID=3395883 RepID=UPI0039BD4A63